MSSQTPCPFCQKQGCEPVVFTPWGGVIGPRVFSLVKCRGCGKQFNGRSGRCVAKAIKVYTWVTMAVLAVVALWAIHEYMGDKHGATESDHPVMKRQVG